MNSFRSASAATEIVLSASSEYKVYSMGNVTTIFPGLEKCLNEFGKRLREEEDQTGDGDRPNENDLKRFEKRCRGRYGGTCNALVCNKSIKKGEQIFVPYDSGHSEWAGPDMILGYIYPKPSTLNPKCLNNCRQGRICRV